MKESSVSVASEAEKSRLDRQERVPIIEALKRHRAEGVVPFHVPGHKHGRGNPAMVELFGSTMMELDLNAMADIDDLAKGGIGLARQRFDNDRTARIGPGHIASETTV